MGDTPLMPIATAVWLIDNTSLTFDQIADFCGLHALHVKGIADGDVNGGVRGIDPIATHQLTRDEIERAQGDEKYRLKLSRSNTVVPDKGKKAPRYTPVSKRQNRPDAIAWMVRNHPEISDGQISKLLGTTKTTIEAIRNRTHWNSANLTPQDPVGLGLCSQIDLDTLVRKAAGKRAKMMEELGDDGLAPVEDTTSTDTPAAEVDLDNVFSKLDAEPTPEKDESETQNPFADVFGDSKD